VYRALGIRAADVLAAGGAVIVDATFLSADFRAGIERVAERAGVPFTGIWLEAQRETLESRLLARVGDASDATIDVLRAQLGADTGPQTWARHDASGPVQALAAAIARTFGG
jgi:predicted kinase